MRVKPLTTQLLHIVVKIKQGLLWSTRNGPTSGQQLFFMPRVSLYSWYLPTHRAHVAHPACWLCTLQMSSLQSYCLIIITEKTISRGRTTSGACVILHYETVYRVLHLIAAIITGSTWKGLYGAHALYWSLSSLNAVRNLGQAQYNAAEMHTL